MTPTYTQTGTFIAVAGIIVSILAHFGINATVDQVATAVSGIAVIYGVAHQAYAHYLLAKSTGTPTQKA